MAKVLAVIRRSGGSPPIILPGEVEATLSVTEARDLAVALLRVGEQAGKIEVQFSPGEIRVLLRSQKAPKKKWRDRDDRVYAMIERMDPAVSALSARAHLGLTKHQFDRAIERLLDSGRIVRYGCYPDGGDEDSLDSHFGVE